MGPLGEPRAAAGAVVPPGERRSARRVFAHLLSELAHHTGHADILRESIDGQRSMG